MSKDRQAEEETLGQMIFFCQNNDVPQNQWSMGRITDVNNDQKGLV